MSAFLLLLILSEVLLPNLTCASRVLRQTTKVRISAIGDTIILRFLQPHMDTKLEGYIMGYGSSLFSKQVIHLPEDGEPYETELDAEPKYLVAVQPVNGEGVKKQCAGKEALDKPLHLVIGSVSPTSVMLSWGTLVNTLSTESNLDDCLDDGYYTVRYREKEPKNKWHYQTCPTSDTIINQLKPDTPYEFGVRAESDETSGAWSPPVIHNTADVDMKTPLSPVNLLTPKKLTTEVSEVSSTSMPALHMTESRPTSLLRHSEPPPTQRITQDTDKNIHKPLKPENIRKEKKPLNKRPHIFSASDPVQPIVTQTRPVSLLKHPEANPTQSPVKDIDIPKPLKPEIFQNPEKPITESPQAFSVPELLLYTETQSQPVSIVTHPEPPSTQRVMQDIPKPQKPKNIQKNKKLITEGPQTSPPSVPIIPTMIQSRKSSLLGHQPPPPIPRVTLGTESDGIGTSHPSEDSLFLTQTLTSTHTAMSNLKTPKIVHTHHSIIPSHSITTQHPLQTTQSQMTTRKPLFDTFKTQSKTTKSVSSTVKTQLHLSEKRRTQPKSSTNKFQFSIATFQSNTTQFQGYTTKYPLRTAQPKLKSPQSYTIHPQPMNQSQHSTKKGQRKMNKIKFTTLDTITTQSQHVMQPQYTTTQSPLHISYLKPTTPHSQPLTTKSSSVKTQSQPPTAQPHPNTKQFQPHTTQPQAHATQSLPYIPKPQPIAIQSQPYTTQSQTSTVKYYPITSLPQSNKIQSQHHTAQPQSAATQTQPHSTQFKMIPLKHLPRTSQPQLNRTQSKHHTSHAYPTTTQSQSHLIKPQVIKKQPKPSKHRPKSQTKTVQPKQTTTQSKPRPKQTTIKSKPQPKLTTIQSKPTAHPPKSQITTVQTKLTTTQSKPTKHLPKSQTKAMQPKLTTIQSKPTAHPPKSQITTVQTKLTTTQSKPTKHLRKSQTKAMQPKQATTQSKPTEHLPNSQTKTVQPKQTTSKSKPSEHQPKFQTKTVQPKQTTTKSKPSEHLPKSHTKTVQPKQTKIKSKPSEHLPKSQTKTVQPKQSTAQFKPQPKLATIQSKPTEHPPKSQTTTVQHKLTTTLSKPSEHLSTSPTKTVQPKQTTTQFKPTEHPLKSQTITLQPKLTTTQSKPFEHLPKSPTKTMQPKQTPTQSKPTKYLPNSQTKTVQPKQITIQTKPTEHLPKSPQKTMQPKQTTTQFKPQPNQTTIQFKLQPKLSTIQFKSTEHPPKSQTTTVQPRLTTTQSKPIEHLSNSQTKAMQPKQPTIQSKPEPKLTTVQSKQTEHTLKSQTKTVQPRQTTSQSKPTEHPPKSPTTTVQTKPTTIQSKPTEHPPKSQTTTVQPKLTTTQSMPTEHPPKSQTKTMQPKLTITKSKPRKIQQKFRAPQSHRAKPQPTTTQSSKVRYQHEVKYDQQPVTNQHHKNIITPRFTHEPSAYYQFITTFEGLSTTEFHHQANHHPTSATIEHFNTNTLQNSKNELSHMTEPKKPVETPSEISSTPSLPWGETKLAKKLPVNTMAPRQSLDGHLTKPVLASGATNRNQGHGASAPSTASTSAPMAPKSVSPVPAPRLPSASSNSQANTDAKYKGRLWNKPNEPHKSHKKKMGKVQTKSKENELNMVDKNEDIVFNPKLVNALPFLKPSPIPPASDRYQNPTPTTTPFIAYNGSKYNMNDNSSGFSPTPNSEVDPMGNKRFIAPHVVYQVDKPPEQPCSITHSLRHFPDEENVVTNISGPPKTPPANLTVVSVEGCPSFVILDWEKTDNETTEYEVTSSVASPNGEVVSVVKTNQTHAAVENLTPNSSYEFTVTPKNELGAGPSSESVAFSTESADPRVSNIPTGKNAIWSSFSFKADSYSECTGTQYVKRTWYRKFVGIQLCNSLRYKIYLSDSLKGKFYDIGDETGHGEDHCQFVDSFLDGRTGGPLPENQLPLKQGYFRAMRQEPVKFGKIGGSTQINYVAWYECGVPIPGSW